MLRLGGGLTPLAVRTAPPPVPATEARVLNRSVGGLGLKIHEPIEPGVVVEVRSLADEDVPNGFFALVRHCRRSDDGWVVGCEFIDTRPWD